MTALLSAGLLVGGAHAADDTGEPAVFATGGSGRFKETIQWLQWADYAQFAGVSKPNVPILDYGQSKVFTNYRDMGDAGKLVTQCTLSNLQHLGRPASVPEEQGKGPLVATIPGAWAGDALDNLYNVGGPGAWNDGSSEWHNGLRYPRDYVNKNTMVIGLANGYAYNSNNTWDGKPWGSPGSSNEPTGFNARVSFDVSCQATLKGLDGVVQGIPLDGLVFADAEASSTRDPNNEYRNEWVQATAHSPVSWRVLDTLRSDNCAGVTADAVLSNGNKTLQLRPTGEECVYQNGGGYRNPNGLGGPDVVMFMRGATDATVTVQGSGYSAVALGMVISTDFGDAPESYGKASSLFQPTWTGGEVTQTTDAFGVGKAKLGSDKTVLGSHIDAEGYQMHSDDALGDNEHGEKNDEDGVSAAVIAQGINTQPGETFTMNTACMGPGKVAGWIDWNHNGTFDQDTEKSDDEVECAGGNASLNWTVPRDVVRSVDNETGSLGDTYMRLRITTDKNSAGQKPTGNTAVGEVEDYKVAVRIPTLQLTKNVEAPYASTEVPALTSPDWTLKAEGPSTVSGKGTTGDPKAVKAGAFTLSESSAKPHAGGYKAGDWACVETPGTQPQPGTSFSSTVAGDTLTVKGQDRVTCTIVNTTKPAAAKWTKTDKDGNLLGGSHWTLKGPDGYEQAIIDNGNLDADKGDGSFRIENLKWGTYTLVETQAPEGFNASTKTFTTTIDGTADLVGDFGAIINMPSVGSVVWTKVDYDNKTTLLEGSEWSITPKTGGDPVAIVDCVDTCAQDASDQNPEAGSFKVELPYGEYTLAETKAPAGFQRTTQTWDFTISKDVTEVDLEAIANEKQDVPYLPLTGGLGADFVLASGGLMFATALGLGAYSRRKREIQA
ncbi:MAG: hypothetical protein CSA82_01435 [Actinobacteria bacterium]|nr:MAG: hypothetical protein CSA82_01435 [Actinomycetota bacterium]